VQISLSKHFKNITINNQVKKKLYKHRKKCYDALDKYILLIIDGMDQKKKNTSAIFCSCTKKFTRGVFVFVFAFYFILVSLGWLYGF
jgi:hypothetical protein